MTTRLVDLHATCGQSPWLDNLQRSYLTGGRLSELVRDGIRGLTSNPTIFQKAIQGSADYDEQFSALIASGMAVREAYWELVLSDIRGALEVFAPLYRTSDGGDGFVSVEVDPSLAEDTDGTLAAARALHERINQPNVMIKIPATTEGVPAIRRMIDEGRSVNVTLIFSLERYLAVAEAYIGGLEERHRRGEDLSSVASVASFFISRVDSEVDARLVAADRGDLCGRAAIAQAVLVYDAFAHTFSSEHNPRWAVLEAAGASVQRPLWASTSTKNPDYPDTLYVDRLIGPHTVNTLPENTLEAFAGHGTVERTIDADVSAARDTWSLIAEAGIDMNDVSRKLESEGVASFIRSFDDLIATLDDKARTLAT